MLYPLLLDAYGVADAAREQLLHELATRDLVGIDRVVAGLGLSADAAEMLARIPRMRGGPDVLDAPPGPLRDALDGLRAVVAALEPDVAQRVIVDLGRFPRLGYYTGTMFEVYDPQLGEPLGGGGRYDDLLGRFGRPLPAVGFALAVDRLHAALAGEERGETSR